MSTLASAIELEPLIDELRATGAEFHRRGWSLGTSSNYSVVTGREPLELLVTVSGKDKGRLAADDFVRVAADGKPVEPNAPKSSAETLLHTLLASDMPAEIPTGGSVLHTHSVYATMLTDRLHAEGAVTIAGYEMLKGLEGIRTHQTKVVIPIFDNTQDIPAMAEEVRPWLREALADESTPGPHAFLIHKHGLYTWGKTIAAARRHIEILEFLFECEWRKKLA